MKQFLMGNQILSLAAKDAGAKIMFGYPITPSTEILETWISYCSKHSGLSYLQTEDEMAAGFAVIGSCLAGKKAFTATAGPGNVLMQDAFSMAEAQRIPTVAMIMQRGGLSTSTVIYSQEEVRLTCFGGNGEGFRVVYSTSNLQELYDYTLKAFYIAWKYRWPTFILADGYQGKMVGSVNIHREINKNKLSTPILKKGVNLRNCFDFEEEINTIINQYQQDYENNRKEIEEYELIGSETAKTLIIAHGIVASACKPAITKICAQGKKFAFFRPITLRPFPNNNRIRNILKSVSKVIVLESALGQLTDLVKREYSDCLKSIIGIYKPAVGFTPDEIYDHITKIS